MHTNAEIESLEVTEKSLGLDVIDKETNRVGTIMGVAGTFVDVLFYDNSSYQRISCRDLRWM